MATLRFDSSSRLMGLDAFKTEGPRTHTKKKNKKEVGEGNAVHVLKGTEVDTSMVPGGIAIHTIAKREKMMSFDIEDTTEFFVCDECNSVSQTYEDKLKVDKLAFRTKSWYSDFMDEALEAASEVSEEEVKDELSIDMVEIEEEDEDEEEEIQENEETGGLMSFKT